METAVDRSCSDLAFAQTRSRCKNRWTARTTELFPRSIFAADFRLLISDLQVYPEANNPTATARTAALRAWVSTSAHKRKATLRLDIEVWRAPAHSDHTRPAST